MNKQEFIAELSDKLNEVGEISQWHSGYKKGLYDALVLTRKLEEPEKPIIPQFVADFIKKQKKNETSILQFGYGYFGKNIPDPMVYEWIDRNEDEFIKACLNGYEVEKEKRYRLSLVAPILNGEKFLNKDTSSSRFFLENSSDTEHYQTIFTEKELEDIDETGFEREEVEEDKL